MFDVETVNMATTKHKEPYTLLTKFLLLGVYPVEHVVHLLLEASHLLLLLLTLEPPLHDNILELLEVLLYRHETLYQDPLLHQLVLLQELLRVPSDCLKIWTSEILTFLSRESVSQN